MWTCAIAVLLFFVSASYSAGGSLKLTDIKFGSDCRNGACTVHVGTNVAFQAVLHMNEEDWAKYASLGINLLTLTLKWDDGTLSVNQATTCPTTGGYLLIDGLHKGLCSVTLFASGQRTLKPYTFTVPKPAKSVSTHLKIYAYAKWSDGTESKDYLIGSLSVNVK